MFGKRILLFVVTNLVLVTTVTIVLSVFGIDRHTGGLGGLFAFCLAWGMIGSFFSLAISRMTAKWSLGVKLVDGHTGHAELDWLYRTVAHLAERASLPMPEVGIWESEEVNAFATGPTRSRALVACSTGLLRRMDRDEIEGVLAHELAHVANGDMVTMTLLQGLVNAFVMFFARIVGELAAGAVKNERLAGLVYFVVVIVAQIVFGLGGLVITSAFSRRREYRADAGSARLAGRDKMVAALRRLQTVHELVDDGAPALAALKIAGKPRFAGLMSTHPDLEDRIAALRSVD